jgi:hypothetical protein
MLFKGIHRHYAYVGAVLEAPDDWEPSASRHHTVVMLVGGIHRGTLEAVAYAKALQPDELYAVHIAVTEEDGQRMRERWDRRNLGVELSVIVDHYRELYRPLIEFIDKVDDHPGEGRLTVVVPEFTTYHWWEQLLHNQSAWLLKARLARRPNTVTTSVPLVLGDRRQRSGSDRKPMVHETSA